jgi:uncharacterized protein YndB with AHSA1/START domain
MAPTTRSSRHARAGSETSEISLTDQMQVDAPIDTVWLAIEDPVAHASWHPFVTEITGEHELGQVRVCAVLVGGRPGRTRERCVEHDEHRRIMWAIEEDSSGFGRMVSGWRAGFTLAPNGETTLVTAESTFRPKKLIVPAVLPMIRRKFHRAQRSILAGLKDAIESSRSGVGPSGGRT